MKKPVIFIVDDDPAVLKAAPERLNMIERAGHKKSKQISVPDADHYFRNKGDELTMEISRWLDTLKLN